ncbi:MAG: GAF domain-containing protein [Desulfarculaceae bacterium]|nr:GAF domain-containing protein [Desulfarculaceae bacterium]
MNEKQPKNRRDPDKTIEVLFRISDAVSNTRNLDELYRAIHKSLDEILNVDNFYIAIHHEDRDSITFPYHVDEQDDNPDEIPGFSGTASLTGRVISERKPLIFFENDIVESARAMNLEPVGTVSKVWLGSPLIIQDRVIGAIVIQSYKSAKAYEKEDLELLNSISRHVALAIERKESEDKLAEQRQVLEKILESSPVGIALIQDRKFKWVNTQMVEMFGYDSKKDFENKSTKMIYPGEKEYEATGGVIYKSMTAEGSADYEAELARKDGTRFPVHIKLNCTDTEDPAAWTIATLTDLSRKKAAELEKYEKERLQGVLEMAGAVCHEINQPLQAIIGYSELLLMNTEEERAKDTESLATIQSQAARIGQITKKLSGITRYRTMDYSGTTRIVDIWGASPEAVDEQ